MSTLRARNGAVLAKIESVEGVAETLSGSTDAVLVENPTISFNPQQTQTNEVTGSLDNRGPIPGGLQATASFDVYLKGSGTAGTAPEWGKLLRALGWAEVITASALPGSAEAAAAGSTTTVTMGASFAATAQLYRGMPLNLGVNPAGGALSFISDYSPDGASKVATLTDLFSTPLDGTTTLQIPANVLYMPASNNIPTLTLGLYFDGTLYTMAGCRGNQNMTLVAAGPGRFTFSFQGIFTGRTDAAVPAATYDSPRPPIWTDPNNDGSGRCLLDRSLAVVSQLTFDNGNTVAYPENPNASQGFDLATVSERSMTGTLDPQMELVATRNILDDLEAGTQNILHARYGTVAGNRVALTCPTVLFNNATPGNRQGILTEQIAFSAIGQDSGAFVCVY